MSTIGQSSSDTEIQDFFSQTSATCEACDTKAKALVGGKVVPVTEQGDCSYTVYAGPESEFVVQFRLQSLMLNSEVANLASEIYASLAPKATFHGQIGDDDNEPLLVFVRNRIQGISHLDFILADKLPENSDQNLIRRNNIMSDVARYNFLSIILRIRRHPIVGNNHLNRLSSHNQNQLALKKLLTDHRFFAFSWRAPQEIDMNYRENLRRTYIGDLQLLLRHLPSRFHLIIQNCLDSMEAILSLPMVLLHKDFGTNNIMVDKTSFHLTSVIDWAEAEVGSFGQNLHTLHFLTGTLHLKNGWRRYADYRALQNTFWSMFQNTIGGDLPSETMKTIKAARTMGLLRSYGFTNQLANQPKATPIQDDDETGRYNMLYLDGFLINPATRYENIN